MIGWILNLGSICTRSINFDTKNLREKLTVNTGIEFWYCTRLELEREQGKPHYGRFVREAIKTLFSGRFSRHPPELPRTEFLFVVITENHIKHFRPVAAALARRNHSFSIVYTSEPLFQKYEAEWPGISFSIESWVGQGQYFRAVRFQTALLLKHAFSSAREKSVIIRFAKQAYLIHQTMLRLLSGAPKKVVLFKAEAYQANAILLACKQLKTPSFAIQHGLIGDTDQVSNLSVDKYLVWSELFKKRLEQRQAGCQVLITGNAAYDAVFQEVEKRGTQKLPPAPLRILVLPSAGASHTPLAHVHLLLDAVLHFAQHNPTAIITLKPHPADHAGNVQAYLLPALADYPNVRLLDRFEPVPFENHHIVAINNSGAGMESCIWGRPLLVFSPSWEEVQVKQYIERAVAEFADSTAAFSDKILKIKANYSVYQEKCRAFTEGQLAFHGMAAEKIVEVLTC